LNGCAMLGRKSGSALIFGKRGKNGFRISHEVTALTRSYVR
jgi:hypothetical protein